PALARAGIALALAPWHVLAARLLDRTGKGIRSAPRDALLAESVDADQRGRAFGLNRSMDHLGAAMGQLLASGLLWVGLSMRSTFAVASALGLCAPLLLFLRLRDPRSAEQRAQSAAPAAHGVATRTTPAGGLQRGFAPYLTVCVLFALGNSS